MKRIYTKDELMPRPYPKDNSVLLAYPHYSQWFCYDNVHKSIRRWWYTQHGPENGEFETVDEQVDWYIGVPSDGHNGPPEEVKPLKYEEGMDIEPGEYWAWCPDLGGAIVLEWPENETLWALYAKWFVPMELTSLIERELG